MASKSSQIKNLEQFIIEKNINNQPEVSSDIVYGTQLVPTQVESNSKIENLNTFDSKVIMAGDQNGDAKGPTRKKSNTLTFKIESDLVDRNIPRAHSSVLENKLETADCDINYLNVNVSKDSLRKSEVALNSNDKSLWLGNAGNNNENGAHEENFENGVTLAENGAIVVGNRESVVIQVGNNENSFIQARISGNGAVNVENSEKCVADLGKERSGVVQAGKDENGIVQARNVENGATSKGTVVSSANPIEVVVRDCKSDSEMLDRETEEEQENDSETTRLVYSLEAGGVASPGRGRSRDRRKYGRSKSWCARTGDDSLTGTDIRLLRERLLRTQSRPQPTAILGFTRQQKLTLAALALVDFMSFCSMSIMAPFFPREANEKGMTDSVSGFVFSFYALIMFVTSPLFGKILPLMGAKFLLMSGIFLAGSCNLLFGVLEYIYEYNTFTLFCFLIRGLEALGASAYSTASYVYVVNTFPNNIGSVLGILETFIGLGMSVGPAIGGLLYSIGGFGLPFYVLGIAMVITLPINYVLLPIQEDAPVSQKSGSLLELVRVPAVVITGLVIVVVSNTWAFLDPTLEPHLRQFDLNANQVGLIFLLFSGLYGIFSPIWGWLADRMNRHWCMMVWGLLLCTLGLLLLGPSPFLPFLKSSLWLNLVGLSIVGISVALTLLPTFQGVLSSSIDEGGCSENIGTYSMVAGVWSCMYSLGEVVGPSLGGVLLKNYGFPMCSTIMAAFTFIMALITLTFFALKESSKLSGGSDTFSDSNGQGDSWQPSSEHCSEAGPSSSSPLLGHSDGSSDSRSRRTRIQSYGGTGISNKLVKELNQNQQNTDHTNKDAFKLKSLLDTGKPTYAQPHTSTSVEGLRALLQSDFYQKYLDETLTKYDSNDWKDTVDIPQKRDDSFNKRLNSEIIEQAERFKKNKSGILPKLGENNKTRTQPRSDSFDILKYNEDKVKYYNRIRKDDCEELLLDRHQVTDVRGTVTLTSTGACEV